MFFGTVPPADAEGAMLVHSTRAGKRRLKKGHHLTREDVASLTEAGINAVTVVRLEDGDVHEDEAARLVAEAAAGDGLSISAPFTGRVNLIAEEAGVTVLDRNAIDHLNLVDEAVTIATLPPFEPVSARQMVATIKIIPFAAPGDVVERCVRIARAARPLIRVAPYRPISGYFIQTVLPDTKPGMLDKTTAVLQDRMTGIGGRIVGEDRVDHETAALAQMLKSAMADRNKAGGASVVMIAGASAITDRRDVIPAAIEAAGGTVDHFGMPVDPGNLLLMGRIGETPVIGLPGCARSPKLNGFDWLLQRLSAGLTVESGEIMTMGVGGLLKEIETRPQPRAGDGETAAGKKDTTPKQKSGGVQKAPKVTALLLAGGRSTRMGQSNKLLQPVDGVPMVRHAATALTASKADRVVVVTGHEVDDVRAALEGLPVEFTHNPLYRDGLSTSLKQGLAALDPDADAFIVALGDMPGISSGDIDRLIAAFDPVEGRAICIPVHEGKQGNPVLFAYSFAREMAEIKGDVGARQLIGQHEDAVCEVETGRQALIDIDTPEALAAWNKT